MGSRGKEDVTEAEEKFNYFTIANNRKWALWSLYQISLIQWNLTNIKLLGYSSKINTNLYLLKSSI